MLAPRRRDDLAPAGLRLKDRLEPSDTSPELVPLHRFCPSRLQGGGLLVKSSGDSRCTSEWTPSLLEANDRPRWWRESPSWSPGWQSDRHWRRRAGTKKWSENGVLCTFSLRNVLRATTTCNFSSLVWPAGSAPAALASLFDPPEPQIIGKTQCFATFLPFCASASSFF